MQIDLDAMSLAQQVLTRQNHHATAVGNHLESYARLSSGDLGLILQLLMPINDQIVDQGKKVTTDSSRVFVVSSDKMTQSRDAYITAERTAHRALAPAAEMLGTSIPTYSGSAKQTLGAAGHSASRSLVSGGGSRVNEAVDPSSFLTHPHGEDPGIKDVRASAGKLLRAIDWVVEKLCGFSPLIELVKPFAGNWVRMKEAEGAWIQAGDAMNAIGQNTKALAPAMSHWTGKGSDAFRACADRISVAHTAMPGPAKVIARAMDMLVKLSRAAADFLMKTLRKWSNKLLRMAAEASVPVVGWAASALEIGFSVGQAIDDFRTVQAWIQRIYDFVTSMASNIAEIADKAMRMARLYATVASGAAARVS